MNTDAVITSLIRFEGVCLHMYLDTKGLVTVAVGNLLKSPEDACKLPFETVKSGGEIVSGTGPSTRVRPCTPHEITVAWEKVRAMAPALPARNYKLSPSIELTNSACRELCEKRLVTEFVPALVRLWPGFSTAPEAAQLVAADMIFNLGVAGFSKFHHLLDCLNRGDYRGAAPHTHVATSRDERNAWRHDTMLQAVTA